MQKRIVLSAAEAEGFNALQKTREWAINNLEQIDRRIEAASASVLARVGEPSTTKALGCTFDPEPALVVEVADPPKPETAAPVEHITAPQGA